MMKNRGITLIALVITIIVMLILAAVSINYVISDNNIISRAKQARDEVKYDKIKEEVQLAYLESQIHVNDPILNSYEFSNYLEEVLKKGDQNSTVRVNLIPRTDIYYKENYFEINMETGEITEGKPLSTEIENIITVDGFGGSVYYKDGRIKKANNDIQTMEDLNNKKASNYAEPSPLLNKQYKEVAINERNIILLDFNNKVYSFDGRRYEEIELFHGINGIHDISWNNGTLLFLDENNKLYGYGNNYYNQFGFGEGQQSNYYTVINISELSPVVSQMNLKKIYASSSVFLLDENGDLYVAGYNYYGELGIGNKNNQHTFTKVNDVIGGKRIIDFAVGKYFSIILTEDGKVYTAGGKRYNGFYAEKNTFTCLSDYNDVLKNKTFSKVAAYSMGACIDTEGKVYVWNYPYGDFPVCINDSEYVGDIKNKKIVDIDITNSRAIIIDENGEAYDFGSGCKRDDDIVVKSINNRANFKDINFSKIACDYYNCVLLDENGKVYISFDNMDQYMGYDSWGVINKEFVCLSEFKGGFSYGFSYIVNIEKSLLDENGYIINNEIKTIFSSLNLDISFKEIKIDYRYCIALDKNSILHIVYPINENEYEQEEITDVKKIEGDLILKNDGKLYDLETGQLINYESLDTKIIKDFKKFDYDYYLITEDNLYISFRMDSSIYYYNIEEMNVSYDIEKIIGPNMFITTDNQYIGRYENWDTNEISYINIFESLGIQESEIEKILTDGFLIYIKLKDNSEFIKNLGYFVPVE